ncbi:ABC transporter permease [Microbacterium sp. LjRoot45]|uniref:FtsX-like permease family protein n=1 Tax=Microbacterium sp. LjRoot45 TaxID=3342329 RepID=UPI003ECE0C7B
MGTVPHAPASAARTRREGSRWSRWRVAVRLARRQVRRTWVSSLLIATLVALPIAGLAGAAVFVDSMMGSPEEKASVELGRMQAWVQPVGVPGAGMWQMPTEPQWTGYAAQGEAGWVEPEGEIPTDPFDALPAGTESVYVGEGRVRIETAAGLAPVQAWSGAVWDSRFAGRYDIVDGRAPTGEREVMVTPATLARAGTAVGGTITDADSGDEYLVTGTIDAATLSDAESAIAFYDADRFPGRWYLPELRLDWAGVQQLNEGGVIAYSREVVLDPPVFSPDGMNVSDPEYQAQMNRLALVATLAAAGVAAGYMVVMLAGAAFAVSARRQQRALAIAASVGADARDLRRTVRLQGTVLGLVGGIVGTALGVGVAALAIRFLDDGSAVRFWGFHVPWPLLAGILVFAVLVGTAAALMPARGVARSDAMSALRGARRPQRVTAARPLWGSLMLVVGVGITVVCGLLAAALATNSTVPWDSPLRWLPIVGIIGGPILAQLGIVLSGRWLLWLTSLALAKLGIAARIASRDAVANGARTVPAFAAIGATVFAGVFAMGMVSMSTGLSERTWTYSAPVGTAIGTLYSRGPDALTTEQADEAAAATIDIFRDVGVSQTAVALRQSTVWADSEDGVPADLVRATALVPQSALLDADDARAFGGYGELSDPQNNITVLDVDDIEVATGIRLDRAQRAAYEGGAALVTQPALVTDDTIEVAAWSERQWQFGRAPNNVFVPPEGLEAEPPLWTKTVDAFVVTAREQAIVVAMSPATADAVGLVMQPHVVFGAFDTPPTTDQRDRLFALGEGVQNDAYAASVWIESGPTGAEVWIVPLLAAMAVLVVGASAVALGLARFERRPDDATLTAVGGTNTLRRRIGFWQGLVIVGFGTAAGAVAGILPPIGFMLQSQGDIGRELSLADVPWWLLVALAVVLPLVVAVANAIVPPRRPELTRRTAIA